jgi:Flp pilus assembly protein TadB
MNTKEIKVEEIKTEKESSGIGILFFALAHLLCCGLPLLLVSGFSIVALFKNNPVISIILAIAVLSTIVWFVKKRRSRQNSQESKLYNRNL